LVEWFYAYQQAHSMAPTMQEIADGMGVSKVTVFEHVGALYRKGVFSRQLHTTRSLRLLWDPTVKDLTAACKRYRAALKHYAQQAVGGEVARDALEGT
jgi:predicted ArsR family transcriptional regulator